VFANRAAFFGMSSVGWVRPFCRTALQPMRGADIVGDADFGVDPFLGTGRTSPDNDGPGPLG
jgi:hypothetical protein